MKTYQTPTGSALWPTKLSGLILSFALALPLVAQEEPVLLDNVHIDIGLEYDSTAEANPLSIGIHEEDAGNEYESTEAIMVVNESTRLTLPPETPFGEEGDPIWVLGQSPTDGQLFVGVSAEELPIGVFDGSVDILLKSVEGPGHFFTWQTDAGVFDVKMNSKDGVTNDDRVSPLLGGHDHLNWGFSTNGIYHITFQATAQRVGESTNVTSEMTTFTFHVLPLPIEQETPFQQWQRGIFGADAPETTKGPVADPDEDGMANAVEYALGLNPETADRSELPQFMEISHGGSNYGAVRFSRNQEASDVTIVVEATSSLTNPAWVPLSLHSSTPEPPREWIILREANAIGTESHRFYRVTVQFH